MSKITSIFWVVLTVIILIVPIFYISYFFSVEIFRLINRIANKLFKITIFKKIKIDILEDLKNWEPHIMKPSKYSLKKILNKIKDFMVLIIEIIKFGLKNMLLKISSIDFKTGLRNIFMKVSNVNLKSVYKIKKNIRSIVENTKSDISYEEVKISYDDANFLWVAIDLKAVINSNHKEDEDTKNEELSLEEREEILRNKKLIDKITYESLVFKKEGRFDEYEKKIIEWLAIDPDDKELNKLLAEYYFSVWNHKKALSLLKRIIDIDPKDHKAIRQIGEIYLVWWEYDVAEILINKAISMNWDNPKYYASLVELLYNTDRKMDAIIVLENELIKLRPGNLDYLITLAELYEEMWELQNAKKYYFRILEQDQSNEKIKRKLQKITDESVL